MKGFSTRVLCPETLGFKPSFLRRTRSLVPLLQTTRPRLHPRARNLLHSLSHLPSFSLDPHRYLGLRCFSSSSRRPRSLPSTSLGRRQRREPTYLNSPIALYGRAPPADLAHNVSCSCCRCSAGLDGHSRCQRKVRRGMANALHLPVSAMTQRKDTAAAEARAPDPSGARDSRELYRGSAASSQSIIAATTILTSTKAYYRPLRAPFGLCACSHQPPAFGVQCLGPDLVRRNVAVYH